MIELPTIELFDDLRGMHLEDHPHVCGGDPVKDITEEVKAEYSPRMWG